MLAVWYEPARAVIEQYGDQLEGKVVIDITNPVNVETFDGLVAELARAGGLNPIEAGSLKRARELEALGFLHMALQDELGTGYGSAVKLIG